MKLSKLYRDWANVLDMCEGTSVDPNRCWKFKDIFQLCMPSFQSFNNHEDYKFAVCLVENEPVFIGDTLWVDNLYQKVFSFDNNVFIFDKLGGYMSSSFKEFVSWNNDPYAKFKEAIRQGKQVAFQTSNGTWVVAQESELGYTDRNYPLSRYKIVEDDLVDHIVAKTIFGKFTVKMIKSGLNGEVFARVVNE